MNNHTEQHTEQTDFLEAGINFKAIAELKTIGDLKRLEQQLNTSQLNLNGGLTQ